VAARAGVWQRAPFFARASKLTRALWKIALAAYGAMADPRATHSFLLFGQFKMGFFGCTLAEVCALLISLPPSNLGVGLLAVLTCLTAAGVFFVANHKQFRLADSYNVFVRYVAHVLQ